MPGEKVAKVKVGLYEAVRDGMVVNLLLEAIPDLHLRLDANRAWTPLKGQQFAKYVNPDYRDRIAFLEEPCKTRDDSRAFARETDIAIAWDESLREPDFAFVAEEGVRLCAENTPDLILMDLIMPVRVVSKLCAASRPDNRRIEVPELPR